MNKLVSNLENRVRVFYCRRFWPTILCAIHAVKCLGHIKKCERLSIYGGIHFNMQSTYTATLSDFFYSFIAQLENNTVRNASLHNRHFLFLKLVTDGQ